eukprot:COSAG02_NODE_4919_length_4836_cov_5.351488_1_plen_483_part_00
MNKLAAAKQLFKDMDTDGSGIITRKELSSSLKQLGMEVSEDVAHATVDSIDLDHSGDVDQHEFTAWMEHNSSRLKTVTVALKIVTGLGQIVSKQEETTEQKLPGPQWDSDFFNVLKFNVGLIAPICEVDYTTRFLLSSLALPLSLILLVAATWATNGGKVKKQGASGPGARSTAEAKEAVNVLAADHFDEQAQIKRGDYYFAFFLVYPTMTQTWFDHFNCRQLPDMQVLQADYGIRCYEDSEWWVLACISIIGLIVISFGVPISMYLLMRRDWSKQMRLVKADKKSRVIAYRDFGRKYDFVVGDFKPEAYYAESLDLIRKLFLSGVLSLIAKGTVFQSFCSVLFSMTFVMLHIKTWPYPFASANLLKLFTDLQLVFVSLVGMLLRFDGATLQQEQFGREFYGGILFGLLVATAVPTVVTVLYKSPAEKVHLFLQKVATVHTDKEGSKMAPKVDRLSACSSRGHHISPQPEPESEPDPLQAQA